MATEETEQYKNLSLEELMRPANEIRAWGREMAHQLERKLEENNLELARIKTEQRKMKKRKMYGVLAFGVTAITYSLLNFCAPEKDIGDAVRGYHSKAPPLGFNMYYQRQQELNENGREEK